MAWTYFADPANVPRDYVRLLIGDTNTADQQLQDAEIDIALARYNGDPFGAAGLNARMLAAKYARDVNSSIESVREEASERYKHYSALAKEMEIEARNAGNSDGIPNLAPFVSGVTNSDIEQTNQDSDRLKPLEVEGQYNNPPGISYR